MTTVPIRSGDVRNNEPPARLAVITPQRQRLAIVSTYDKLCGIAAYTRALARQLADVFDVTVFDLDQDLLRSGHRRIARLADRHVKEICAELAGFDAVNLQLEFGILGREVRDICRRLAWLIEASPRLSVTFHTVKPSGGFPYGDLLRRVGKLQLRLASDIVGGFRRDRQLSVGVARMLRRAERRKPVSIIVHNRHDASDFRLIHGFERVFDHPLTFNSAPEVETVISHASRGGFPLLDHLRDDAVLVGVFGFLNDYKGFGTVIRALHHLPESHHLLIFGGIHPNEIRPHQSIHPYLMSLLDDAQVRARFGDTGRRGSRSSKRQESNPRDLSARLRFMGTPEDTDFLAGMAICDVVVFPYLEVGQSASGPISQALELGRRIVASRTRTFLEFAAYHPGTIEFFDIGNHLELANRILARPQYSIKPDALRYTVETNRAVYFAANSAPGAATQLHHGIDRGGLTARGAKRANEAETKAPAREAQAR